MSNVKVEGKNAKGEAVVCFVRRPNSKDFKEAKLYSNAGVAKSIKSGSFLTRSQTTQTLKDQGIWGDAQEQELKELAEKVDVLTQCLHTGLNLDGSRMKKSQGKDMSIEVIDLRNKQLQLLSKVNELDNFTIEAQAENDEFDYLFSVCLLDEEGNKVFESVDQYKEKAADEPYYFTAASELQGIIYGFRKPEEIMKERIEYKFLTQYKFINDKLQLIDADGNLVDRSGKPVPKEDSDVNNKVEDSSSVGEFLDD